MLKKHELHDRKGQPVVNRDKGHDRTAQPDVNRDTRHEFNHGPVGRRTSNTRQLGCVFQDMKPPKSILRKSSDMQKPTQRVKFTKTIACHTKIRDQNHSLGKICPGEPIKTGFKNSISKQYSNTMRGREIERRFFLSRCRWTS